MFKVEYCDILNKKNELESESYKALGVDEAMNNEFDDVRRMKWMLYDNSSTMKTQSSRIWI